MTVYVLGCEGTRLVKIGHTKSVRQRMSALSTIVPYEMKLLWQSDPEHGEITERKLHQWFRVYRRRGEWFDFGDDDPVLRVSLAVRELEAPMLDLDVTAVMPPEDRQVQVEDLQWTELEKKSLEELRQAVQECKAIKDPRERCKRAQAGVTFTNDMIAKYSRMRTAAIIELIAEGKSREFLAEKMGMSRSRIGQLIAAHRKQQSVE